MNNLHENSSIPDDKEANDQVRQWLGGGIWLGRVRHLNPNGWGYITAYDDDQVLTYPDNRGEVTDVWFRHDDLELDEGDWVVFEPKDAPPEEKDKRENPYLIRAGSVKLVREISELCQHLPTRGSPFMNELRDNYLECLFVFGQRLFIAEAYAHELETRIETQYQEQFSKWQSEEQSRIEEREATLEDERRIFEEERQRITEELTKERGEVEETKREIADIERKRSDLEETRQTILLYEEQVNESLRKWGFEPISTAEQTDEPGFAEFDDEGELIDHAVKYIEAQGFNFPQDYIVNFYTCLKTGAIVILAGLSGTGKSSLVRLFADAVGVNYELVPVKATWSDDTDLLGFYHPEKKTYISTRFLDTIVEANAQPERLFFICLDEMNLSRVEHYFSDFLSVLEQSEERKLPLYSENEWKIRKSELERQRQSLGDGGINEDEFNHLERNVHCYRHKIPVPHNVFICGTVNVDETTYQFSDKVLDRVQIIQFETIEFPDDEVKKNVSIQPVNLSFSRFKEYRRKESEIPIDSGWFNELNKCLQAGGFHFGHRVKQQIEDYCGYALHSGLFDGLEVNDIVDIQIVQKVLPKIRGINTQKLREMFYQLRGFCAGRYPSALDKIERMEQMESINYWEVFRYVG